MKIILDPGHGRGDNTGAVKGYAEGTAMFAYAYRLADKLREQGFDVGITRAKVTDNPSLTERGKMAKGADMFVSLHSNAVNDPAAYGVSTFYSIKRDGDKHHAEKLCKELATLINGGTRARGATTRKGGGDWDYYTVIQYAVKVNCPHVFLIEHGFHSNPEECAWLMQDANLEAMADLETKLICGILGAYYYGEREEKPQPAQPTITMRVNTPGDTLNVRTDADYRSEKLGELPDGSDVEVLEKAANGWKRVRRGTLEGWVNGSYLIEALTDKPAERKKTALERLIKVTSPMMRGDDVRWAQERLAAMGYDPGKADGIYGKSTEKAVKAFQAAMGLVVDGIIGQKTWAAM